MKAYDCQELCENFKLDGRYISALPYGEGHINDTYLINTTSSRYILQRVNQTVFAHPEEVMHNIILVTDFLHEKIIANCGDPYRETLTLVPTKDGKRYYVTKYGDLFRMYLFISHALCYQTVENPEIFYKSAKAFGHFQNMLKDFPAEQLKETIPAFHNTVSRYQNFKKAVAVDCIGRKKEVEDEIQFVLDREKDASMIVNAIANHEIPLRVTHNDTKLNNVMIDEITGEGLCVIDLDTVMPGSMLFDFGDSIRFGASTAAEDEQDLSTVWMDIGLFEQYTKGYLEELGNAITAKEAELLPFSAKLMTLECGTRFLTDYLEGDHYFKVHRPRHNLDRARTQFKLVADMESKLGQMQEIVQKYFCSSNGF
ncbi:phosphotransferase enzyme family protein [Ructibacterium gallinarum]|uniref:Aminoglycoside phosphotransferase family protein n=1 Tax=Ructibacterium gallinarum TaxID=2779355 RepID=A0A9D5RB52_9FIRM|nr:aminoglycoside phosphotransferase family protein [Ructibacterium gallinarum]MBE5039688.1 aminoglycoside phosphotransferase family protein [Ructibacterium gallinarum]